MIHYPNTAITCSLVAVSLLAAPAAAQLNDLSQSLSDAVAYRVKNFSHCYVKVRIEDYGSSRKGTKLSVDSWARGQSIRNDVHGDREARVVIHEGTYMVQLAGNTKTITVAPLSEYKDPWKQFGVVHQRDIGMVDESLKPQANGETRWVLMNFLDEASHAPDGAGVQKDRQSDLTRYSVNIRRRVPEQLPVEVASGRVKLKDYLSANPGIPLREFEVEYTINFNPSYANQLTGYESKHTSTSDGSIGRTKLVNEYQKEYTSGVWYPKTSVWEHYYNHELLIGRRVEVLAIDFKPIPDSTFSLSGLDLKDGTQVIDRLDPRGQRVGKVVNGTIVFPQLQSSQNGGAGPGS